MNQRELKRREDECWATVVAAFACVILAFVVVGASRFVRPLITAANSGEQLRVAMEQILRTVAASEKRNGP